MRTVPFPARQRGVAALLVTTMLCLVALLVVGYASRDTVLETRAAANRYRTAQAFQAAESGLDWALARLNDSGRVGTDCRPSADPAAASSRSRWLRFSGAQGQVAPATWSDAGTPVPLRAACVRSGEGWTCSCPASGAPALPAAPGAAIAPSFDVSFLAGTRPGTVRVVATGCTGSASACTSAGDASHEAVATVQVDVALVPALRSAPPAALTVRGDVDAGTAALGLHHPDASAGLAVHAGGRVTGPAIRLSAPAGASLAGSIAADDASIGSLDADRFFARFFGMPPAAWKAQPAATRIACEGDCTAALAAAVAAGNRLVVLEGDATLAGPAAFGTADEPIALVATGRLALSGAVAIHGVVHAGTVRWDAGAAPAAFVRGALLSAGGYEGTASADVVHDGAVLALLSTRVGTFVRINGSWKDF